MQRKIAWTSQNLETLFVVFSGDRTKTGYSLVDRDLFTKSGESSDFSRSYTGVPFRNLAEIPRLTAECKQRILGQAAVGAFTNERVFKEVDERGHPLLWAEWKPVALISSLIRDFQVSEVVDFTPGSGAGCLAAIYSNVQYMGIPYNLAHETWLLDLLQRLFVALVLECDVGADKELIWKTKVHLERAVMAAKLYLPKKTQSVVGDSFTGGDDSDVELPLAKVTRVASQS